MAWPVVHVHISMGQGDSGKISTLKARSLGRTIEGILSVAERLETIEAELAVPGTKSTFRS